MKAIRPVLAALLLLVKPTSADAPKVLLAHDFASVPAKPWLTPHGFWKADDGCLRGTENPAEHHGASVRGFASFVDATFEYEVRFDGGRVHTLGINQPHDHLFHIDFKPDHILIVKNALTKEPQDKPEVLAQAPLKLETSRWYPVRIVINGTAVIVNIAGTTLKAQHEYIGREKGGFNLYVNGDSVSFGKFRLISP